MRAVVQRVARALVTVDGAVVGSIGQGFLVLLGVRTDDEAADVRYIASKIAGLRLFEDASGRMNRDLGDVGGRVLLVSQFTLYGDCRKGRRPSFDEAAPASLARVRYDEVVQALRAAALDVETGTFRAAMQVESVNDGPVTVLLDSSRVL
jgi:D-tyrosyl-tRNA(Tyr) deacylase